LAFGVGVDGKRTVETEVEVVLAVQFLSEAPQGHDALVLQRLEQIGNVITRDVPIRDKVLQSEIEVHSFVLLISYRINKQEPVLFNGFRRKSAPIRPRIVALVSIGRYYENISENG
jgi:hypothetical protein